MFELAHGCVGQSLILKPCSCGTCYFELFAWCEEKHD